MFPPIAPAKIAEALGEEEGGPHTRTEVFKVDGHADTENLWGEQPFYILRVPGNVVLQGSWNSQDRSPLMWLKELVFQPNCTCENLIISGMAITKHKAHPSAYFHIYLPNNIST